MTAGAAGRPLRLAFLGDPNSGHTRHWIAYFLDRGHAIHLLLPAHDLLQGGLDPRVEVDRFTAWPPTPLRGAGSVITAISLRRLLRTVRPDVLHAHGLHRYGLAARLSGFHPYVVTVWGSDVLVVMRRTPRLRLYARLILRGADLVTGGSSALLAAAIRAGARADRSQYIHFGVDTDRFAPGPDPIALRRRLDLEGRRVVLSSRAITPLYHQRTAVETLPALPDDVVLLMTRHLADADELAAVERRAGELGVADRLRIVAGLDDAEMPDLYRLADVVLSIPASDGGPITVAEALAVGRPVVATDLPSVREWLGGLDPEALVPIADADATARAIRRALAQDGAERTARATAGRAAVVALASRTVNMARMETLYRQLAADRHRSGVVGRRAGRT